MQFGLEVLWRFLGNKKLYTMETIILNKQQESELEQIYKELLYSLKKTYSNEELVKTFANILLESGTQTVKSKKEISVNFFKKVGNISGNVYKISKAKVENYQNNGFKNQLNKDFESTKSIIKKKKKKIKTVGINIKDKSISFKNNFLDKSKNEKIELLCVGLMSILIFYASAGGEDFEGGIPDSDLNLGIGFHRHIVSHSIIMGLIIELLMRIGIEIINKTYQNLPSEHHQFWDNVNLHINKYKGIAIGSMWAGISVHLIKDSGILGHGVKPYTGVPIELSKEAHQGLFAANGTASAFFTFNK